MQDIKRRSFLFVLFPGILTFALLVNLIWEIVRNNIDARLIEGTALVFTIADNATTLNLLALVVGLLLARLQYARAVRPVVGLAIQDKGAVFSLTSDEWYVLLYNAGSGIAVVKDMSYYVNFVGQQLADDNPTWVPLSVVNDQFKSRGLKDGEDYFIRWMGKGAPIPATSNAEDGFQVARLTIKALAKMNRFHVRIRFSDSVGDSHERIIPCINRLPSVTQEALERFRQANSSG